MGKSRLIYHMLQRLSWWWSRGFWCGDPKSLEKWRPRWNTIFVIDDAAEKADEAFQVIERIFQKREQVRKKIRVLLVDRLEGEKLKQLDRSPFSECRFRKDALTLERFSDDEARNVASQLDVTLSAHSIEVADRIPLYVVGAAGAARDGKPFSSRTDILFREAERIRVKAGAAGIESECLKALALATLARGISWDHIAGQCQRHKKNYEALIGKDCTQELGQLTPDALGAAFLLSTCDGLVRDGVLDLLRISWQANPMGTARTLLLLALDFPRHPKRSLLDTPPDQIQLGPAQISKSVQWWGAVRVDLIANHALTENWPEMVAAQHELREVAGRFPADRGIQLELAKGLVNTIGSLGEQQKWPEMGAAQQELREVARRFAADREIQLKLANGAFNSIINLGKHQKWAEMGAAQQELREVAGRFPADREIHLELAKGAVNAIWVLGEHQKWAEMGAAKLELREVAGRFQADREIQLAMAKGGGNAIWRLGEHQKWPEMRAALQELREVVGRFPGTTILIFHWG